MVPRMLKKLYARCSPRLLYQRFKRHLDLAVLRYVPTRLYYGAHRLRLRAAELWAAGRGGKDRLAPPASKTFLYGADPEFKVLGPVFLKYFRDLGGLQPEHKVLDIGCGIGRMALALADYLAGGEYRGFDIVKDGVAWCRENITPRHPDFQFESVDIFNRAYNPGGRLAASEFKFPYPDGHFDFVFTTSVFTHMLPADLENYLAESARVMKRGARCLHTFFLLNEEALALMARGAALLNFSYQLDGFRAVSRVEPEKLLAYDESRVRELYAGCGLRILEPMHYGAWCARGKPLSGQDIVVAEKT